MKSPVWILLVALLGVVIVWLAVKIVYKWYYVLRNRNSLDLKSLPSSTKRK